MTHRSWDVLVVAHRGIVSGFPENTIAAYRAAMDRGFSAIEVDLRATADGGIVVMHDDDVDRTTNGHGRVSELTFDEIRSLDAGSYVSPEFAGQQVPTFGEVLEAVRGSGVKLVLDIKPSPQLDHQRIVELTEEYRATLDVIVGPRSIDDLRDFKRLNPNLRTLGLVPGEEFAAPDPAVAEEFARAGADIIRLWPPWIFTDRDQAAAAATSPLVERMHQLGKPVWTTADIAYRDISPDRPREDLAELVRLGVSGILTDVPDLLREVLAARRAENAAGYGRDGQS
jgi:glycerophosphoryl diester phosphodiesterase